jgi:hypothetical protein
MKIQLGLAREKLVDYILIVQPCPGIDILEITLQLEHRLENCRAEWPWGKSLHFGPLERGVV